jgi:serine O-acetyltransferase
MGRLTELLDADWERLTALANAERRPRNLMHAMSPRFAPVVLVRAAQCLNEAGWLRLAKLTALVNFILFGIEVAPRISIGPGLVLMHTQGTVIGARSIGKNATIYQQVTLGAVGLDFAFTPNLRPTVGNGVIIGAGAKVLGALTLGDDSRVGANAVVLTSVPPRNVAIGVPAKNLPPKTPLTESATQERAR